MSSSNQAEGSQIRLLLYCGPFSPLLFRCSLAMTLCSLDASSKAAMLPFPIEKGSPRS